MCSQALKEEECHYEWVGPTSALHRSLFCYDLGLGPSSYTQHYYIAWWNVLNLTFCTNISCSKTWNKTFCVCHHISTSFIPSFTVRGKTLQRWDLPSLLIFLQLLHKKKAYCHQLTNDKLCSERQNADDHYIKQIKNLFEINTCDIKLLNIFH